jgi:hypothetical protein
MLKAIMQSTLLYDYAMNLNFSFAIASKSARTMLSSLGEEKSNELNKATHDECEILCW